MAVGDEVEAARATTGEAAFASLRRWGAEIEATVAFVVTCVAYFPGAGRSLDYDSSITAGKFVATPSLLDPFRREFVLNNHPLFSFADHVVYSLGGQSESALRALPIVFGAATVAVLAWWCARRWGLLAGAAAALVTASNPMFAGLAREVRGYSLLALAALVSSLVFVSLLRARTHRLRVTYVVSLAVSIATHLYGLLLIPVHAAVLIVRRELSRQWLERWVLGAAVGGLAYVGIVKQMWAGRGGRAFASSFPSDLAQALLGQHALAIVATVLLIAAAVWASWPLSREVLAVIAVLAAMIGGIWLVVQPVFLFARFFVWLVPAVGFLAARAVARWPVAIVLAVACAVSTALYEGGSWTEAPNPTREAAQVLRTAAARGMQPCVLGFVGDSLAAYSTPPYRKVQSPSQLTGCDVALEWLGIGPVAQARALLPYRTVLTAQSPYVVFSRRPLVQP
jgi:hypothetical protein